MKMTRIFVAVCTVLCAICAGAQAEEHRPTIEVSATGYVEVIPDRVSVSVGVRSKADTTIAAQTQVNEAMNATLESVRELDIDGLNIETTGLRLSPIYSRIKDREPELLGYAASRNVRIEIGDLSRVGEVIDAAILGGINDFDGVMFSIADPESHELEALRSATLNAKARAETIAGAMNMRLGGVVTARDSNDWSGGGRSPFADMEADTHIEPSPIDIEAEVTIIWELLD